MVGPYPYLPVEAYGPYRFGMSRDDLIELVGPPEEEGDMGAAPPAVLKSVAKALGLENRLDAMAGQLTLSYETQTDTWPDEPSLLFFEIGTRGLELIEIELPVGPIEMKGVDLVAPDMISRIRSIQALSTDMRLAGDDVLFPEFGFQTGIDPEAHRIRFIAKWRIKQEIEEMGFERADLPEVIDIISSFEDES